MTIQFLLVSQITWVGVDRKTGVLEGGPLFTTVYNLLYNRFPNIIVPCVAKGKGSGPRGGNGIPTAVIGSLLTIFCYR